MSADNIHHHEFNRGQKARKRVDTDERVLDAPPSPPSDLPAEAKRVWSQAADVLVARRGLSEGDLEALRLYAIHTANVKKWQKQLAKDGPVVVDPTNGKLVRHPLVPILDAELKHQRAVMILLGLSPQGRGATGSSQKRPVQHADVTPFSAQF